MFDDHKLSSFFAHSLDNMAGFVQSSDMVQAHFLTSIRDGVSPALFESFQFGTFKFDANANVLNDGGLEINASETL